MATENSTRSVTEIAWDLTQQLRCAHSVITELAFGLRAGEKIQIENMEDLTAVDMVLGQALGSLSALRSEVDMLPAAAPKKASKVKS